MKTRQILVAAALATIVAVPAASNAQYRQDNRRQNPRYERRNESEVERLVVHAERESNDFRRQVERLWDSRRERDWSRGWDRDWSRGRNGYGNDRDDNGRGGYGNGNGRNDRIDVQGRGNGYGYGNGQGGWDSNSRYSRRYSPKQAVQRLDQGLEKLRAAVTRDRHDRNRNDYRVGRDEMMEVVRAADNVDFYFGRSRGHNSTLDREWAQVKRAIDSLARFYNVRAFDRG